MGVCLYVCVQQQPCGEGQGDFVGVCMYVHDGAGGDGEAGSGRLCSGRYAYAVGRGSCLFAAHGNGTNPVLEAVRG